MFFRLFILFVFLSVNTCAQEDILIKEILSEIVEDLPEDLDLSELTERLIFLKKHPINLNRTTPEELKTLFFLSPLQIANFFSYLATNNILIDVLELQAIPGFDVKTVQILLPFVQLKESDLTDKIKLKNLINFGEHDLVIRYAQTLEKQKGFRDLLGSRYLGTPERLLLRYKYNFSNRISLSLVTEKDAGEQINTLPMDFTSGNLTINAIGIAKKISIGDYSLQFGQGLTLWSGFGFGKGPDVTSLAKNDNGLKPYSSANEYSFFRGIATTIGLSKKIDFTPFWSYRKYDAAIGINQEGIHTVETLNETGYHRTQTELKNRNSISQNAFGAAFSYHSNNLNMGVIGYQLHFDKAFIKNEQPYRLFNFTGKNLTNLGFHYSYTFKNAYIFGEIAKSLNGGMAAVNGLLISLSNRVSAVFLVRDYQKNYHNFFYQATSESGGFNESGFYTGLNISPSKKWMFSLYGDYFKFPWLKFRIDAPSQGYEVLAQLSYSPSKTFKTTLRYKSELKQQNTDIEVPINYLDDVKKETFRLDVNWRLLKTLNLQNKIEFSTYEKGNITTEVGYLLYQDVAFKPIRTKYTFNLRIGYFNTPSYNSRIYAYEDDILYNFSFGMYNGKGWRNYVNVKYKLVKNIDLWLRYSFFYYHNIISIGSGLDEINGNKKSEAKVQLRYQF